MKFRSLAAAIAVLGALSGEASADKTRVIVTVMTEGGAPLKDVRVVAVIDGNRVLDAATNDSGRTELNVDVPAGTESIEIQHESAVPTSFSNDERKRISKAMRDHELAHHFDRTHRIAIKPNQSDYELKIIAWSSVNVTGAFVDAQHYPLPKAVWYGPEISSFGYIERGAVQPLRNVRKGAPVVVAAQATVGKFAIVKAIPLDASQTVTDVDLGKVVMEEPGAGLPIQVKVVGDAKARSIARYWPGVTFVSTDGKLIVTFEAGKGKSTPPSEAPLALQSSKDWVPQLPAGEYYVVPGYFFYNDDQAVVLQLLAKKVDLAKSDLPRIVVHENNANEITADIAKAHEAIQRLATAHDIKP